MKKLRRFLAFVLCAALCFLLLTGCGSRDTIRFKMIAELNQEEFCVAFRKGDRSAIYSPPRSRSSPPTDRSPG